jgi:tRNA(Ile2) C34 agmatinyltransferase TiaS
MAVAKNLSNRHVVDQIGEHRKMRDEHDEVQKKLRNKLLKRPDDLRGDDYYAVITDRASLQFDRDAAEQLFGRAAVASCYKPKITSYLSVHSYGEGPKKSLRPPRATPVKRSGLFD